MAAQVDQVAIEPASKGVPGTELDQALLEPAAQPLPPAGLLQQVAEPAVRPDPLAQVDALEAEATARPDPPAALLATLIEVVWREPPPRGIFAFRHDWSQPWVERWEWKTQILRSRDGTESRIRLRRYPRRAVEMLVTAWDAGAIGLDAWLTEHQGREALFPFWPVARRVTADAAAGGTTIQLDAVTEPVMRATQTETLDNWGQGPALIQAPDGDVQQVSVTAFDTALNQVSLDLPLARPVVAGSTFVPLVRGTVADATTARRHCAAVTSQPVEIRLDERVWEWPFTPDLTLEGVPVIHEAEQWQPEPSIEYAARVEWIDNRLGRPWIRRVDDRPAHILSRRWLVAGQAATDRLLGLFEHLAGRLNPVWLPDEFTGLTLAQAGSTGDDRLLLRRARLPWHWEEPGLGLLIRPAGQTPVAVRVSRLEAESETVARLLLADPLPVDVPVGTPVTPLHFARLDQDRVEFTWHANEVLEVAARFMTLARCHPYLRGGGDIPF